MATQAERVQAILDACRNETVSPANVTKNLDAFVYNADDKEIADRYEGKLKANLTMGEKRDWFLFKINKARKDAVEKAAVDAQEVLNRAATEQARNGSD